MSATEIALILTVQCYGDDLFSFKRRRSVRDNLVSVLAERMVSGWGGGA